MSRLFRTATRLWLALLLAISFSAPAGATGAAALRPALLEVTVNGQRVAEPALFLQGPDGALYAGAAALSAWRMRLPPGEPIRHEGEIFYRISGQPALDVRYSEQSQSVTIDASIASFATQRSALRQAPTMPMTRPATGTYLNYDLFVEHGRAGTSVNGAVQLGIFTRHGTGETSFVAQAGPGPTRAVRLESSWTIDRPSNASTIRIGDSVSFGGLGAPPVRFAGVHYHRNYAVQPGFITMPLPSGTGSAAVPSVVDVYVNNVLQGSREVAPGPFELSGIPVQTGGGTVQLVVRDLLGREVISEQSYYASPRLLARGLHDFSYEVGFLRRRFGRTSNDYGAFMASTTQRYGLSDRITGEAHVQASAERQMAGLGFSALAFDLGQVGGSVSVSRSDEGVGYRLAASFERQTRRLSFGLRAEHASAHFGFLGMPEGWRPPRYTLQAFADLPVWRGSVGVQILHRAPRDGPRETFAGLSGSFQILPSASLNLFARHTIVGRSQTSFGGHLTFAFGGRRSAQAGVEIGGGGNRFYAGFQSDPPEATGSGFRAAVALGKIDRFEAAYAHNFSATSLLGEVAHVDGRTGVRLSATGSIGLVDGRVFASRSLGESFAIVRVEDRPGIRVYADDHLIGVTGRDGTLIVPGLRAFDINRIRVDDADLPLDAQVDSLETAIRPFARSGTAVRFSVRYERGVLMRVRRADGSPLPAGAVVSVGQEAQTYVVVGQGEIYVPGLTGTALLRARWGDRSCAFTVDVPPSDDPQPRLDGLICREDMRYAAN